MPYIINRKIGAIAHKGGFELDLALKEGWELYDPTAKVEPKPIEKEVEKPIIEAPAPKRGRPFKGTH